VHKARSVDIPRELLTDNLDSILLDPSIDIVVEAIGGLEPARSLIEKALGAGKHVVTANKYVVSEAGEALQKLAASNGKCFLYEASVGGAIPIIEILNRQIIPDRIASLHAILNGTTNFILTRMAEAGEDYEEALLKAQQLGFSEPDPSFDVSGKDAGQKLAILISLLKHRFCPPSGINLHGIEFLKSSDFQFAAEHQMIIKPLSIYEEVEGKGFASVEPVLLSRNSVFANVRNEYNVLSFTCRHIGKQLMIGKGAGELPTANAVVSDLRKVVAFETGARSISQECFLEDISPAESGVRFCRLSENPQKFYFYVNCSFPSDLPLKRRIREHFARVGELIQEQARNEVPASGLTVLTEKITFADLERSMSAVNAEAPDVTTSAIRILQEL
jgi:homoserine dehydrogenase